MEKHALVLLFFTISIIAYGQTIETIQQQIDDLEKVKKDLQNQIEYIDTRLSELYTEIHNLTLEDSKKGYSGTTRKNTKMYDVSGLMDRSELSEIPANTRLSAFTLEDGSYRVSFNGVMGFIPVFDFVLDNPDDRKTLEDLGKQAYREEQEQIRLESSKRQQAFQDSLTRQHEQWEAERLQRQEQWETHKVRGQEGWEDYIRAKYSSNIAQRINDHRIWIGMTKEMMIDSWGQPEEINRTVFSWGVHEQCIYIDTYIYIEDGKVTAWQD